ncbi:hypothetical protein [Gordonia sp. (in: high G+C Gram-positive bacteria)]|uniref:hypothetical protein n=1 Tax=Gordonia sp. (in: high G+C Gram-positive bacteria) TaxID=84139 RepID=UPI003C76EDD8
MRITLNGGPFDGRHHDVAPGDTEARLPHLIHHGDGTPPDLGDIATYRPDKDGIWHHQA